MLKQWFKKYSFCRPFRQAQKANKAPAEVTGLNADLVTEVITYFINKPSPWVNPHIRN